MNLVQMRFVDKWPNYMRLILLPEGKIVGADSGKTGQMERYCVFKAGDIAACQNADSGIANE